MKYFLTSGRSLEQIQSNFSQHFFLIFPVAPSNSFKKHFYEINK